MDGAAQLRALLLNEDLQPELAPIGRLFASTVDYLYPDSAAPEGHAFLGSWTYKADGEEELAQDDPVFPLLAQYGRLEPGVAQMIQRCSVAKLEGIAYRPANGTTNIDSYVEAKVAGKVRASRIECIVKYSYGTTTELLALVSLNRPIDPRARRQSPYSTLPELGAYLVRQEYEDQKHLIPLSSIVCPVALCPFTSPLDSLDDTCVIVPIRRR